LAMGVRDRQLVEKHLRALVRVRCLDAADEANGITRIVDSDQQMMVFGGQKLIGPRLRRRSVEERGAGEHDMRVSQTEVQDLHRTMVRPKDLLYGDRRPPRRNLEGHHEALE